MHDGNPEVLHCGDRPGRVRGDELLVVGDRETAHPGVEQLSGAGAGEYLGAQEGTGHVRGPAQQRVPGFRVRVHEGASPQMILGRSALDEIRSQGERSPGETDQGGCAQFGDRTGHSFGDGSQRLRVERAKRCDIRWRANRSAEHRTAPRDDVDIHAGELQRHHDVAEEDGGVHPVSADRLQGDLTRQLGGETGVEHGGAHPQFAVFRQGASRLAHEPHRGHRRSVAAVGPQQRRLRGATVDNRVVF